MSNTPTATTSHHESEETIQWDKHFRWLAPVTAVILLGATAFMWNQGQKNNIRSEVLQAYTQATTADALELVADSFPKQPEAPLARLQAASMYFNQGNFESALTQYELFVEAYPSHPMAFNAQWGVWMSQEGLGELETAMSGFQSVTSEDLLFQQALLGQARIFEKQGQNAKALAIYDLIQADYPESAWSEQARVFGQVVSRKLERSTDESGE
ncbi:tetratricopeptide repeat protein [Kiritimatiellota bacterium B12222]|nr:tetratricopeptide repeat protein [Kiritimatiellota bacterium B12222]